ncbi:MAG: tetratricopeptide repeat protein [Pseudomonadota bacterium]
MARVGFSGHCAAKMEASDSQSAESRLVGWKRIAKYLGCSERSARRWEREESLPIHRQQHQSRSTVYALPAELDAWLNARSVTPVDGRLSGQGSAPRIVWLVAGIGALALLTVAWLGLQSPSTDGAPIQVTSEDALARDLYERGRSLWRQRGEVPNARAIKLLTEAVERDDSYAEAWAALASAWLTYPTYTTEVTEARAVDEALLAADRAVRLDPSLAEPRSVMATVARRRGDWLGSERVYAEALAADPDNTSLLLWFAGHYRELGLMERASELTQQANDREPNSPPILTEIAMNENSRGRLQESLQMLDFLWMDLGVETPVVWVGRWMGMTEIGDYDRALRWVELTPFTPYRSVLRAYVERQRDSADRPDGQFTADVMAAYEAGLPAWLAFHMLDQSGLPNAALDVLDAESADNLFDTSVVLFYPRGGSARSTERFAQLIARLGFYDYWRVRGAPDVCQDEPDTPLCQAIDG